MQLESLSSIVFVSFEDIIRRLPGRNSKRRKQIHQLNIPEVDIKVTNHFRLFMFVWRCYFIYTLLVTFSSWKAAWQRVYKVCIRLSTSHAMKKSVLLVLLSLQIFLLITAFPSADADSTRIDPLQPAAQVSTSTPMSFSYADDQLIKKTLFHCSLLSCPSTQLSLQPPLRFRLT